MDIFLGPQFSEEFRQHPIQLVDVGARGGLNSNWAEARRHLKVLAFEPEKQEFDKLSERAPDEERSTLVVNVALHASQQPLRLNVARNRGLSSIFTPNRAFLDSFPDASRFDTVDVAEVPADTLDNVISARGIRDVDFIKVDTQGSELLVLQGAAGALASMMVGVEVEAEFAPIYEGQPLFAELDSFMRGLGYVLFDLRPCYWKRTAGRGIGGPRGQIIWADALYLKGMPALHAAIAALPAELRHSKMLKAISVCLLYGYYDYALELTRHSGATLTDAERQVIESTLRRTGTSAGRLDHVPGRRQLAGALHRLWRISRRQGDAWSVSKPRLGNFG